MKYFHHSWSTEFRRQGGREHFMAKDIVKMNPCSFPERSWSMLKEWEIWEEQTRSQERMWKSTNLQQVKQAFASLNRLFKAPEAKHRHLMIERHIHMLQHCGSCRALLSWPYYRHVPSIWSRMPSVSAQIHRQTVDSFSFLRHKDMVHRCFRQLMENQR